MARLLAGCGILALAPLLARADVSLEKEGLPAPALPGAALEFTVTVKNDAAPLTNVVISDQVPSQTTYTSGSASDGGGHTAGVVTWPAVSLAAFEVATRSFQVVVDPGIGADSLVFFDDMEQGADNWSVGHPVGSTDWSFVGTIPLSAAVSWYAPDPSSLSDMLITSTPIAVPANASLRFFHRYQTESGFDGGVVEISTNSGASWDDLGPYFVQGGYNDAIDPELGNPLILDPNDPNGRPAFTGTIDDPIESVADLSSFADSTVQLRFRFGSDTLFGGFGWLLDDVAIVVGPVLSLDSTASASSNEAATATIRALTLVAFYPPIPALSIGGIALLCGLLVFGMRRVHATRALRSRSP